MRCWLLSALAAALAIVDLAIQSEVRIRGDFFVDVA